MKLKHLSMLILVTVTSFNASWALGFADVPTGWAKAVFNHYAQNPQSEIAESPQPNESSAASMEGTDEDAGGTTLQKSDLALNDASNYNSNNNTWTPAANFPMPLRWIVKSSSTGKYSIAGNGIDGNPVATLTNPEDGSEPSIVVRQSGKITLTQAADGDYEQGSLDINIIVGNDITKDDNRFSFDTSGIPVSDGMSIIATGIKMTFSDDHFWSQPKKNGMTNGQSIPSDNGGNNVESKIPTGGTFYKFTPKKSGVLAVKVNWGRNDGKLRPLYISKNGTPIEAQYKSNNAWTGGIGKGETPEATQNYTDTVKFNVEANAEYYMYVTGSKLGFYGFEFYPGDVAKAEFSYGGKPISFKAVGEAEDVHSEATIEIPATEAGNEFQIYVKKYPGCKVVNPWTDVDGKLHEWEVNGYHKLYAPTVGEDERRFKFKATSLDGTKTVTYIIIAKLLKTKLKLEYTYPEGTNIWDKHAGGTNPFEQPALHAYKIGDDGKPTTVDVIENIQGKLTFVSDMPTVATVDEFGNIIIVDGGLGGAKVYAEFKGDDYYEPAETFYNFIIKDGYYTKEITTETPAPVMNRNNPDGTENADYDIRGTVNGTEQALVRVTFGGWKRNEHKYTPIGKDGAGNDKPSDKTDGWGQGTKASDCASIDGYEVSVSGKSDAMDEAMKLEWRRNGWRNGWFKSPTQDASGNIETYPFTLPVRGAYMTFEPQMNGYLTVYILQNGSWNTNNDGIKPGEFRPHAFQVVNQRGLPLRQFSTHYSVTTKQAVTDEYVCKPVLPEGFFDSETGQVRSFSDKDMKTATPGWEFDNNSKNIANWEEFYTYLDDKERAAVYNNWKNGVRGAQSVIELSTGSFMTVQKGIVKYRFHVTGHETYYFFSNFSKLEFCGANFVPDAYPESTGQEVDEKQLQPTAELELSDTWEHIKLVPIVDREDYPSGVKRKKFVVENIEKVKEHFSGYINVNNVQVPQFKTITVKRDFVKDKWNTLTLPFNITQHRVEEIFGKGTELILLNGTEITGGGDAVRLHFIYHEIQNVLPGYPYLIKPTFEGVDTEAKFTKNNGTVHDILEFDNADEKNVLKAFTVPVKHLNPDIKQQNIVCGDYETRGIEGYCHPGNDEDGTELATGKSLYSAKYEEGDIFLSDGDGKLYVSKGSSYGKGYRAYIKHTGTGAPAKSISMVYSGVDDNFDNTTTEIRFTELAPEAAMALGLRGVYNLNGQKVAETADNLPSGIYIVNGQKTVVK
ncbi:hypothetical protein E5358_14615 [Palleniella muris]|uniref:Uncharacterized protein n=1 Tax=Palleniella muris TaxID=3038145 RepID=A0AC61QLH9_9BACT|nr:hypothetical protein [Palleniella muris]TGX79744.1 hypothetical protein E5358_14615 [Palleniella muris]